MSQRGFDAVLGRGRHTASTAELSRLERELAASIQQARLEDETVTVIVREHHLAGSSHNASRIWLTECDYPVGEGEPPAYAFCWKYDDVIDVSANSGNAWEIQRSTAVKIRLDRETLERMTTKGGIDCSGFVFDPDDGPDEGYVQLLIYP